MDNIDLITWLWFQNKIKLHVYWIYSPEQIIWRRTLRRGWCDKRFNKLEWIRSCWKPSVEGPKGQVMIYTDSHVSSLTRARLISSFSSFSRFEFVLNDCRVSPADSNTNLYTETKANLGGDEAFREFYVFNRAADCQLSCSEADKWSLCTSWTPSSPSSSDVQNHNTPHILTQRHWAELFFRSDS